MRGGCEEGSTVDVAKVADALTAGVAFSPPIFAAIVVAAGVPKPRVSGFAALVVAVLGVPSLNLSKPVVAEVVTGVVTNPGLLPSIPKDEPAKVCGVELARAELETSRPKASGTVVETGVPSAVAAGVDVNVPNEPSPVLVVVGLTPSPEPATVVLAEKAVVLKESRAPNAAPVVVEVPKAGKPNPAVAPVAVDVAGRVPKADNPNPVETVVVAAGVPNAGNPNPAEVVALAFGVPNAGNPNPVEAIGLAVGVPDTGNPNPVGAVTVVVGVPNAGRPKPVEAAAVPVEPPNVKPMGAAVVVGAVTPNENPPSDGAAVEVVAPKVNPPVAGCEAEKLPKEKFVMTLSSSKTGKDYFF